MKEINLEYFVVQNSKKLKIFHLKKFHSVINRKVKKFKLINQSLILFFNDTVEIIDLLSGEKKMFKSAVTDLTIDNKSHFSYVLKNNLFIKYHNNVVVKSIASTGKSIDVQNGQVIILGQKIEVFDFELAKLSEYNLKASKVVSNDVDLFALNDRTITNLTTNKLYFTDTNIIDFKVTKSILVTILDSGLIQFFNLSDSQAGQIELELQDFPLKKFNQVSIEEHYLDLVYGNPLDPIFERIDILNADGNLVKHLLLTRFVDSTSSVAVGKKTKLANGVSLIRAEPLIESKAQVFEETLGERVKNEIDESTGASTFKKSSATSLVQLLKQGIKSTDAEMLEKVFSVRDRKVIYSTIAKLEIQYCLPLLDQLTIRIESSALTVVEWIRAILKTHSSYLSSVPLDHVKDLYAKLESRISIYEKLIRLNGRLDLMGRIDADVEEKDEDVLVFNDDGDSSSSNSSDGEMESTHSDVEFDLSDNGSEGDEDVND